MNPTERKLLLTAHITASVGWIGAVLAYLALVIAAMMGTSDQALRASWIALELIGWYVIVPLALTALCTGIGIALATPWGLFRHYWVITSLLLTGFATAVLLRHMVTVTRYARIAAGTVIGEVGGSLRLALREELLHAGAGLVLLLGMTALNMYKPRGLTALGRQRSGVATDSPSRGMAETGAPPAPPVGKPRWLRAAWLHAAVLLLGLAILHAVGGLRLHD